MEHNTKKSQETHKRKPHPNSFIIVTLLVAVFGCQAQSCQPANNDQIIKTGPDVRANLVFFFKKGTTSDEILEFQRTVIGISNEKTAGYASLPGVMTTVAIEVNGYNGEAINFKPNATEEQRAFVKNRVVESPLIYRVYENVVPDEIKDLPDAKDIEKVNSNRTPDARPTREPIKGVITPNP